MKRARVSVVPDWAKDRVTRDIAVPSIVVKNSRVVGGVLDAVVNRLHSETFVELFSMLNEMKN